MRPRYLNVDLEITAADGLDRLVREMGERVIVLYSGRYPRRKPKCRLLVLESSRQHRGPNEAIHALCRVVERLSGSSKRTFETAEKTFDVGYELRRSEYSSRFILRPDTLARMTRLGATLVVSYYREEDSAV